MNPELKEKWVKALRSGEYEQGQDKLHDPKTGTYCCLGVLCRVAGASFSDFDSEGLELTHVPVLDGRLLSADSDEELKKSYAEEIGIKDQAALIILNDGRSLTDPFNKEHVRRHSFEEIADYIEQNL